MGGDTDLSITRIGLRQKAGEAATVELRLGGGCRDNLLATWGRVRIIMMAAVVDSNQK